MRARIYGYIHHITDVEDAKVKAARILVFNNRMSTMHYGCVEVTEKGFDGQRLDRIHDLVIDVSKIVYTEYTHGGRHMQASYEFDYPEAS